MKFVRGLVNLIAGAIIALLGYFFVDSLCIVFYLLTGLLTEGGPMYIDLKTPSYVELFRFQGICLIIFTVCFVIRKTFGRKKDFPFRRTLSKDANSA